MFRATNSAFGRTPKKQLCSFLGAECQISPKRRPQVQLFATVVYPPAPSGRRAVEDLHVSAPTRHMCWGNADFPRLSEILPVGSRAAKNGNKNRKSAERTRNMTTGRNVDCRVAAWPRQNKVRHSQRVIWHTHTHTLDTFAGCMSRGQVCSSVPAPAHVEGRQGMGSDQLHQSHPMHRCPAGVTHMTTLRVSPRGAPTMCPVRARRHASQKGSGSRRRVVVPVSGASAADFPYAFFVCPPPSLPELTLDTPRRGTPSNKPHMPRRS